MFSRLTRQRAMRRAWRGKSSRASLRAWSLRLRRAALTRPSVCRAGAAEGSGTDHRASTREPGPKKWMRGGCFAYFTPGLAQLREIFPRIEELEGGEPAPVALSDLEPLGHGPRGSQLHHKPTRRDDNKSPHGGFGGAEDTQHGVVNGGAQAAKPWSPTQHGEQGFNYAPERFTVAFDGHVHNPSSSPCTSYPP